MSRHTDRSGQASSGPHENARGPGAAPGPARPPRQPGRKSKGWRAAWRRVKGITHRWRVATVEHTPAWARRMFGRLFWYLDMLVVDHGIFRLFYVNQHRLGAHAWRSAQPTPHHIRVLKRRGLRTIVNLRGERLCGAYWLEQAVCERRDIALVDFQIKSRAAPTREQIRAARDLFDRIEYPALMHCKSGADRVGLMSALYRLFREGAPVEQARKELSLRYGHIRQADTGILDRVFEKYLEDNKRRPMPFMEWVDTLYDPDALKREFRSAGWARRLVDEILKRE
ncbi:MAG TPA: protein tyrosine phosphatase [Hyphomicrobiaceae bacterium]